MFLFRTASEVQAIKIHEIKWLFFINKYALFSVLYNSPGTPDTHRERLGIDSNIIIADFY